MKNVGRAAWVTLAAVAAAGTAGAEQGGTAVDAAIAKVYPALVRLHVVTAQYSDGREVKTESAGSGVILSADGYVITNHHVAGRAVRIQCTLANREEREAQLVGSDPLADIAVVKLDTAGRTGGFPFAAFGDSSALRVGDPILAMGSPLALSQSVTQGIVSNTEMTYPSLLWPATMNLDGEDTGSLVKWLGHDAPIFPGNSGGPLVNLRGEIVGINEISLGLAGAIPGNLAQEVAQEIIRHGRVRRSWLGVTVQPLLHGGPADRGVLVSNVLAGSPAEAAGLRSGDVLVAYDGEPVSVRYAEELPAFNRRVLGTEVGKRVEIAYRRDGKEARTAAVTRERGEALGDEAELRSWGVAVRELTLLSAAELRRAPGSGVLVSSLRSGSPAAEAKPPLRPRDIVVEVAGAPVRSVRDLVAISDRTLEGKTAPVPVLVAFERDSQKMLTVVKLGEHENQDRSAEAVKAWIPVATQVLTADLAEALGLKGKSGVRVTQVYAESGGAATGLEVGDVLFTLDGSAIPASRPEEIEVFPALVRQYAVGAKVRLEGSRAGRPFALDVALVASPGSRRQLAEYRDTRFDFSARDLNFQDRLQASLGKDETGALITSVESGGWAALAHMAVGDIVLAVDGGPVASAGQLETRMKTVAQSRPSRVVFFVRRGVQTLFLEMEPAWGQR